MMPKRADASTPLSCVGYRQILCISWIKITLGHATNEEVLASDNGPSRTILLNLVKHHPLFFGHYVLAQCFTEHLMASAMDKARMVGAWKTEG